MGDGRCFTVYDSTRLYNDMMMQKQNITYEDNLSFRRYLQEKGPDAFSYRQMRPAALLGLRPKEILAIK